MINNNSSQLDFLLFNNLCYQTIFKPTPKGAFRIDNLLLLPETAFPLHLIEKVPDVKYDVEQCTKSLAFELPTACAFHLMRIFEKVLISYAKKQDIELEEKKRSIGNVIDKITSQGKNNQVIDILKNIKNHYRNPLMHSEINVDIEEAIALLGVINGALNLLIKNL